MSIPLVTCRYTIIFCFYYGNWGRSGERFKAFYLHGVQICERSARHDVSNLLFHESFDPPVIDVQLINNLDTKHRN